jgi:hypothetical protein
MEIFSAKRKIAKKILATSVTHIFWSVTFVDDIRFVSLLLVVVVGHRMDVTTLTAASSSEFVVVPYLRSCSLAQDVHAKKVKDSSDSERYRHFTDSRAAGKNSSWNHPYSHLNYR